MNDAQLIQKLQAAFDDARQTRMYGSIEIEFRDGSAEIVRTMKTEKINPTENNRGTHKAFSR